MQHVLRTLVIAAFAVSGMNACAPTEKAPTAGPPTGQPAAAQSRSSADASKLIYVTPVEGVTSVARLVLADAIAAALRDANKPAVLADKANEMGPTVSGRVVEVQERDSVYWVTAAWALKAPYGTSVAEYRHQIVVDKKLWQNGAPEAINLLVADAGPMVAGMVRDYVSPMALAEAPSKPAVSAPAAATTAAPLPQPAAAAPTQASEKPTPAPSPAPTAETAGEAATLPAKPTAAASPKTPSVRPKVIPRRPAAAPSALTAKPRETPVETAALSAPPQPSPPKPAETGRPKLLSKGPPPRQPREEPVEDATPRKPPPVLMPVPGESASLVPDPPPVVWSRPSFLIRSVEGAPGDGNVSLTNAMKAALRKRDLTVTDDPRQAGFIIQGRVEVGPAVNGRQQAKIVWAVNTISGEEVGKAVQENAVKAGSLDGPWGRIAEIVSHAAVTGIQELFGVGEKQSSRLDLPPVPPLPDLPREPGRAPPPPR